MRLTSVLLCLQKMSAVPEGLKAQLGTLRGMDSISRLKLRSDTIHHPLD